ncbi:secreted aspartic protease 5 [Diutina catenulata]
MKFLSLLTSVAAVAAVPSKRSPKVLSLDVEFQDSPQLTWFSASVDSDVDLQISGTYNVNLKFGSQKDEVSSNLDTGSSDLWIAQSVHNVSASKNGEILNHNLRIGYDGGSVVEGPFVLDTVYLGETKVDHVQFGWVDASQMKKDKSIMGIGRKGVEGIKEKYDNFPYVLKNNGLINRVAFSLYLNKRQTETGNILFGGIDYAKLDGELVKFESPQKPTSHPWVNVKSIGVNGANKTDINGVMMLDSGYTLSVLPPNLVDEISKLYQGATARGVYYDVDCNQDESKFIEVNFDGLNIKIPITQFIWKTGNSCHLGAKKKNSANPNLVLGATFLQNVYAVYDWEENTISLAKAKYTDATDIREIPAL